MKYEILHHELNVHNETDTSIHVKSLIVNKNSMKSTSVINDIKTDVKKRRGIQRYFQREKQRMTANIYTELLV